MSGFQFEGSEFRFGQVEPDAGIRSAAFAEVRRLAQIHGNVPARVLRDGFQFAGSRLPFVSGQRGIFKPKRMAHLLSIRTVVPRRGGRVWYQDQLDAHRQIFSEVEGIDYSFMGDNPRAADNIWLKQAFESQVPIIYFLGTAPGLYLPIVPTFIIAFDPGALKVRVAFGPSATVTAAPEAPERRYALRLVKQRLHQLSFREMVISAYGGRCAISGLREPLLLDAAHIAPDADEEYGQPSSPTDCRSPSSTTLLSIST